jgi:branched-chain amino acid transport system permease protein
MNGWRYYIILTAAFLLLGMLPNVAGSYFLQVADIILIYMTLAISWDMLLRAGQISFGMAGLCGLGGYAAALSHLNWDLNPVTSIFFAGLAAAVVALFIGLAVLRLRSTYFAIVTLAIAEIFKVIVRNLPEQMGGVEGLILPDAIFNGDPARTYWLVLAMTAGAVALSEMFQKTRIRFALTSIRNDEIVAQSTGINVFKYLVFAFVLTSAIQGIAGGVFAHVYAFVMPESSFSLEFSLLPLTMVILGGMHSTWGAVTGAVILGGVGEYLKLHIPYGHLIVYGLIVVLAILYFPKGIVGTLQQKFQKRS